MPYYGYGYYGFDWTYLYLVLPCVLLAAGLSCLMTFVPVFSFLSGGFVIIISAVAAAVMMSIVHPVPEKEAEA